MNPITIRGTIRYILRTLLFLIICWVSLYIYRSYTGSYHEVVYPGGSSKAVWFPSDFKPRKLAQVRPAIIEKNNYHARYAPLTLLPVSFPIDLPLLIIDRSFFHKSMQTISGQGDMKRVANISSDGKVLIPTQ